MEPSLKPDRMVSCSRIHPCLSGDEQKRAQSRFRLEWRPLMFLACLVELLWVCGSVCPPNTFHENSHSKWNKAQTSVNICCTRSCQRQRSLVGLRFREFFPPGWDTWWSEHLFWIKIRLLIPCRSRSLPPASVSFGTKEMKVSYSSVSAAAVQRVQEMQRPCLPSCCAGISYYGNRSRSLSSSSDPSWRLSLLVKQEQRRGRVTAVFHLLTASSAPWRENNWGGALII